MTAYILRVYVQYTQPDDVNSGRYAVCSSGSALRDPSGAADGGLMAAPVVRLVRATTIIRGPYCQKWPEASIADLKCNLLKFTDIRQESYGVEQFRDALPGTIHEGNNKLTIVLTFFNACLYSK